MSAVAVRAWEHAPLDVTREEVAPATSALRGADAVVVSPTVRRELQQWARAFGQACVEVVLGDRPASQLVRWATPSVHRELVYRARVVAQATVRKRGAVRPQVRQVRACFVAADVAEVALTVQYGARLRALAARVERRDGRWQCTVLEFA